MNKAAHRFLEVFGTIVIVLALLRCAYPNIAGTQHQGGNQTEPSMVKVAENAVQPKDMTHEKSVVQTRNGMPHRIRSVSDFLKEFPDSNDLQLSAATQWGVSPVKDREDAEQRKKELVYIGCSPYYHIDPLHQSIPYLVPRASVLLQDIGAAFFDSLQVKGVPLNRFIVTSVLRTEADVTKLRRVNKNATERSCHLFGTTFDITYNRYETVEDPDGPKARTVWSDTLKWVLAEVLRDKRMEGRCFVKYEVKQPCFHITVR